MSPGFSRSPPASPPSHLHGTWPASPAEVGGREGGVRGGGEGGGKWMGDDGITRQEY